MKLFSCVYRAAIPLAFLLLAITFSGTAAQATVAPNSGPTSGGTTVSFEGLRFTQVETGAIHGIGLTNQGTVYTWGDNQVGQLGDGSFVYSATPVQVLGGAQGGTYLHSIVSIAASRTSSFALTSTGEVYSWGDNYGNVLGDGTSVSKNIPVRVVGVGNSGFLSGITAIEAGDFHVLAITSQGNVVAWGQSDNGELGNNSTATSSFPVVVSGLSGNGVLSNITQISAGIYNSFAVSNTGSVYSWGANAYGALGNGASGSGLYSSVPVQVIGENGAGNLSGIVDIACGDFHAITLTADGKLYGWGYNGAGAVGDGTTTQRTLPVKVVSLNGAGELTGVASISSGVGESFAILSTGELLSWGSNGNGQLGDNTVSAHSVPNYVSGGAQGGAHFVNVSQVDGGDHNAFAIADSGKIYSWGFNGYFASLGNGLPGDSHVPTLSVNFVPREVSFGPALGTGLTVNGTNWTVTSPQGSAGPITIQSSANLFAGSTPATPATVTWNVGTFTYNAPAPSSSPLSSSGASASPSSSPTSSISPITSVNASGGTLSSTGVGPIAILGGVAVVTIFLGAVVIAVRKKVRR